MCKYMFLGLGHVARSPSSDDGHPEVVPCLKRTNLHTSVEPCLNKTCPWYKGIIMKYVTLSSYNLNSSHGPHLRHSVDHHLPLQTPTQNPTPLIFKNLNKPLHLVIKPSTNPYHHHHIRSSIGQI